MFTCTILFIKLKEKNLKPSIFIFFNFKSPNNFNFDHEITIFTLSCKKFDSEFKIKPQIYKI